MTHHEMQARSGGRIPPAGCAGELVERPLPRDIAGWFPGQRVFRCAACGLTAGARHGRAAWWDAGPEPTDADWAQHLADLDEAGGWPEEPDPAPDGATWEPGPEPSEADRA